LDHASIVLDGRADVKKRLLWTIREAWGQMHVRELVETVGVEEVAGYIADVSGLAYHLVIHFSHFVVGDLSG
jgi:hypothetical protein